MIIPVNEENTEHIDRCNNKTANIFDSEVRRATWRTCVQSVAKKFARRIREFEFAVTVYIIAGFTHLARTTPARYEAFFGG